IVQKDPYSPNFGITLIQSKWHLSINEPTNTLKTDNADPITKLNRIASFIFNGSEPIGNPEVKRLFRTWRDIKAKVKNLNVDDDHNLVPPDPSIYLVLACQRYTSQKDNLIIKQLHKATVINLKDFKRIYEDEDGNAPEIPKVFAKINLDGVMKISEKRTDYIGSIYGDEFCKMYNKGTNKNRIKHSQFLYSNVRNRLSTTGDKTANEILKEVKNTIDNEPQEFFSRNNGFTLVVDKVQRIKGTDSWYLLQTPQLVNGGQTANALWEYFEIISNEQEKLKSVRVPIKVVEINMNAGDRQDLCRRVAYASNHQNQVDKRDLYGIGKWIDTLKVWLEKSQNETCRRGQPIFYATKKGEWEDIKDASDRYRHGSGNSGGTPRYFDNALISQYMWATFFGGAMASAKKSEQWSEEMADRLHFRNKEKDYPEQNSLVEQENIWYRNEDKHDFLSEALFVKLLHDEIKESQNRKTLLPKKTYLATLNVGFELNKKIEAWRDPITKRVTFLMLLVNQALRIRCDGDLDLRRKMLNFFIGDTINAGDEVNEEKIFHVFLGITYHTKIWEDEGPFGCTSKTDAGFIDSNALNAIYSKEINKISHSHALLVLFDICRKIAVKARAELIASGELDQETTDIRKKVYIAKVIERLENDRRLKFLNLGPDCKSTEITFFEANARTLAVLIKRALP
ncbi:AIPR family protein, partial [Candidatus Poseidonia alphae]|nr:AIPR family protein [Candidatus Poseidonia alphae]